MSEKHRGKLPRIGAEAERRRYRDLVDMAVDGIVLAAPDGIIVDVNERLCALLGLARDRIVGERFGSLPFSPECLAEEPLGIDRLLEGETETGERVLRRADGAEVVVEMRSKRMPDGSCQAIFHDITELRKAEEALKLKSMFLEAVADSSGDGILVVDPSGKKVLQNQRTIELWKIPPDVAADANGDRQVAHVMRSTKNPQRFIDEIEYQKRFPMDVTNDQLELVDGTVLDRHSAPVLGPDGKNYGRIYHFHDVTGFRQAEEKIRGLLAEKELILREVHHRVKNYMSTLQSILSLQAYSLTEPSAVSALRDAQDRVQGMVMLYDKLYVRAESGSTMASVYMRELVDEIVANFPRSSEVTVEKSFDDFALDAKTMQVLGIIVNELLTNIMKYAFVGRPSGFIALSIALRGERVSLAIRDDGVGMPDATDLGSRTGFGLMLVGTLVKQLGGVMSLESGEGTRFSMEFDVPHP